MDFRMVSSLDLSPLFPSHSLTQAKTKQWSESDVFPEFSQSTTEQLMTKEMLFG